MLLVPIATPENVVKCVTCGFEFVTPEAATAITTAQDHLKECTVNLTHEVLIEGRIRVTMQHREKF